METRKISKRIELNAAPAAVFDALTSSEEIVRYFPLRKVTSTWQAGAELRMEGSVDGKPFTDVGRIETLERPWLFSYSYWSTNHGTENTPANRVTIEYRLSLSEAGTHLQMTQRNLPSETMTETMATVWDVLLGGLKRYIESAEIRA